MADWFEHSIKDEFNKEASGVGAEQDSEAIVGAEDVREHWLDRSVKDDFNRASNEEADAETEAGAETETETETDGRSLTDIFNEAADDGGGGGGGGGSLGGGDLGGGGPQGGGPGGGGPEGGGADDDPNVPDPSEGGFEPVSSWQNDLHAQIDDIEGTGEYAPDYEESSYASDATAEPGEGVDHGLDGSGGLDGPAGPDGPSL